MKFLPHIEHHMSSISQKIQFIWGPTTVVMKKKNTANIQNLVA
jgi:hypothetical protein